MAIMEGMIIFVSAPLIGNLNPAKTEIIGAMDCNLCRCGSYINIIEAIESVSDVL